MSVVTGDPASCSQLGGLLRSLAASGAGGADTAASLDRAGAALQRYAVELAEVAATCRRLAVRASRAELVVDGWRVSDPWPIRAADQGRAAADERTRLQHGLDRAHARLGTARSALRRCCEEAEADLRRPVTESLVASEVTAVTVVP